MGTETRHDFRLHFTTDRGGPMVLNIPRANTSADGTAVAAAMLDILNSGVVHTTSRGTPVLRHSAELITTDRRDFNLGTI
jgi:hypothetical protein